MPESSLSDSTLEVTHNFQVQAKPTTQTLAHPALSSETLHTSSLAAECLHLAGQG